MDTGQDVRKRHPGGRHPKGWLVVLAALVAAICFRTPVARGAVTAEQLQARIDQLVADIRNAQRDDGSFRAPNRRWGVGQTSLAVLALRAAGAPKDDPAVSRGVQYLLDRTPDGDHGVYERSLEMMALQSVDPDAYRPQIAAGATYLVRAQQPSGGWAYGESGRTDNSNSQFAVLGLHAAALSGVEIAPETWSAARRYYLARQNPDGGWEYTSRGSGSYGSMTAAGVASVFICDLWLHVAQGRCGQYPDQRQIAAGLRWLARHFSVATNPRHRAWKFYYLYGLERAGTILARRRFGGRDWYREGVEHLVGDPRAVVMAGTQHEWPLLKNCYAVLFLAKGNAPLVLHKAEWGGEWNANRFDTRFLTHFIGMELDRPVDWQIAPLDAPLDQLMRAPVLYLSGRGGTVWSPREIERVREYVQAGGLIFAEAAGGDAAFDGALRRLIRQAFPEDELVDLPLDHPLYTSYFNIPEAERPPLEAIRGPCWLSVVYARRGLSCPWDVAQFEHTNFRLGTNLVAYATGMKEMEGKLAERSWYVPSQEEPEERGGAFVMGQVVHAGQWRPHKIAWRKVLEQVSERAGIDVYSRPVPIDLQQESPYEGHMLYLTGLGEVALDVEQRRTLAKYLERGGFIFAEAACGSERFDRSFRELMRGMFPDRELERLPIGHPLFEMGEPMGEVNYSDPALRFEPGLDRPYLEAIEVGGRAAVVYSRFDLSSAIDGHPCYRCPSVLEPSASRLALKIVLYGLSS
ncbi:MAG: DUF4159 domain-containing protein [Candidatus Brocadiia bacterium]